jgi:hypothetical protein
MRLTSSAETLSTQTDQNQLRKSGKKKALIDVRKEQCIGVSLGPILAPQPQMVAPDEALPARANVRIPIIISQFYGLIHPTITVSQVGRLWCPQMSSKTFYSA